MRARILVIDDDCDWRTLLGVTLRQESFEVIEAATGAEALALIPSAHFDLMILDVQLPDRDGYEVCAEVRKGSGYTPIIMISGIKKKLVDREFGLGLGADHYFQKPVKPREVMAQVKALLRMASALKKNEAAAGLFQPLPESDGDVQACTLRLDFVKGEFKRGNHALALTALEIKLLARLNQNAGELITAKELLQAGWKDRLPVGQARDRLKSVIKRLRRKIEPNPKCPKYLLTARGEGYYLCLDPKPDRAD